MLYSESEQAWLARRAAQIAESEASAELVRSRASGQSARVVDFLGFRCVQGPEIAK